MGMLVGAQVIKQQLADGVSTRRVGLVSSGAPARQHSEILTPDGKVVRAACMHDCHMQPMPEARMHGACPSL